MRWQVFGLGRVFHEILLDFESQHDMEIVRQLVGFHANQRGFHAIDRGIELVDVHVRAADE